MLLQCVKSIVKKIILVVLRVSCLCIKLVLVLRRSCDRGAMKKKIKVLCEQTRELAHDFDT